MKGVNVRFSSIFLKDSTRALQYCGSHLFPLDRNVVLYRPLTGQTKAVCIKRYYKPNALAIITGDFNPTSTGFNMNDLTHTNNIKQMVKFKTRDSGTLDWFLTNMPNLFHLSQLPKIGTSDHFTILTRPVTRSLNSRTNRKVRVRDMRESAW